MTGKRFDYTAYDDGTESIYDRKKDKYYFDMQLSEIEELLNELAEENEKLKHQLQQQELEYATTCHRLAEENEQLKSLIKALKKSNADFINQIKKAYDKDLSIKELADNCGVDLE